MAEPSRDSDSLIQDYYECMNEENLNRSCFTHPKVRENWRMVLAATTLLIVGIGLLITGTHTLSEPNSLLQASVFLLAGMKLFQSAKYGLLNTLLICSRTNMFYTWCLSCSLYLFGRKG